MLRFTRPLLQALKSTTGITGLAVHPDPLPALAKSYEQTLSMLKAVPESSVYRQATEALTQRKLSVVQKANGDVGAVEKELAEGHIEQIEQVLLEAEDEMKLVAKMIEWKAWEPLEEKSPPGQWQYFEHEPMREL